MLKPERRPGDKLRKCPICGKIVQERGFRGHVRFVHLDTKEGRALLEKRSAKTLARQELDRIRADGDASGSKPKLARLGRTKPIVYRVSLSDLDGKGRKKTFSCPKCGVGLEPPNASDGELKDLELSCPDCLAVIELVSDEEGDEAQGDEAQDDEAQDDEAQDDEAQDDEARDDEAQDDEAAAEKTEAEKEAARKLKLTGLIDSLRACCDPPSFFGALRPPVCGLLIEELTAARDGVALGEDRLDELCDMAERVIGLRKTMADLKAVDADPSGATTEKLSVELEAVAVELRDAAAKKKASEKKPGFWDSL